jgi:hypothetical protein
MVRRSSRDTVELLIRRRFDPSRSQLRSLAFAFEQALPLIRKNVKNSTKEQTIESLHLHPNGRSAASGAHS